jgi:hypothetical protein
MAETPSMPAKIILAVVGSMRSPAAKEIAKKADSRRN